MRILILSHGYPPTISGVTLVVQKVARAMARRGHEVTVVAASDRGEAYQDEDQGVKLRRVRSIPNPFWSEGRLPMLSYSELKEIVAEVQPDVVNTHEAALLSWQLNRLEQEKIDIPEILTCHFLPGFVHYYVRMGKRFERILENVTWEYTIRIINGFDHVVFPTRTQQQAFIQEGLEAPSTVISNGLDTEKFSPRQDHDDNVEARYALPAGPRILFVGRLAKDKKIDLLIEAITRVNLSQNAHLLLVGRGDDRERLEALTASLGMQERIHFLGFVPDEDLPSIYRHSNIFAIASTVEVQSIPTLEAAATGLPIVAVDAAALPELVHNNQNGFLVSPGDPKDFAEAIQKILDNQEKIPDFARASLAIGHQHSEVETFHAYETLYRELSLTNLNQDQVSESVNHYIISGNCD
jgi:glycosyltransferase involved in cell wall biosynthesis